MGTKNNVLFENALWQSWGSRWVEVSEKGMYAVGGHLKCDAKN